MRSIRFGRQFIGLRSTPKGNDFKAPYNSSFTFVINLQLCAALVTFAIAEADLFHTTCTYVSSFTNFREIYSTVRISKADVLFTTSLKDALSLFGPLMLRKNSFTMSNVYQLYKKQCSLTDLLTSIS